MYLPRELLSHLYEQLQKSTHRLSQPVLILSALDTDALCATRILTRILKRDYIPHKIQPISGVTDLIRAGNDLVQPMRTQDGGEGGVVVCLGLGAILDLERHLFVEEVDVAGEDGLKEERFTGYGGVECWVIDARRPWDLSNVFGNYEQPDDLDTLEGLDGRTRARRLGHDNGRILPSYKPGRGGIICFDDGDIDSEMVREREAYNREMEIRDSFPEFQTPDDMRNYIQRIEKTSRRSDHDEPQDNESDGDDDNGVPDSAQDSSRKRKASSSGGDESEEEDERHVQRRRSNSSSIIPSSPGRILNRRSGLGGSSDVSRETSPAGSQTSSIGATPEEKRLRQQLPHLKQAYEQLMAANRTLQAYFALGSSFSEPISSMMYSLASDLGRQDNDLLWWAIVGVQSMEISGRTNTGLGLAPLSTLGGSAGWNGQRGDHIRNALRDEVRKLNPGPKYDPFPDLYRGEVIQTSARGASDNTIRLSPEPRFLLVRHWSLYDSMLHSPYLSSKLHVWSEAGQRRLYKLLAKMGVSIAQSKQSYTHMDMDLKKSLREKLLKYAPQYGLEGLVPPTGRDGTLEGWGFVRSWGWKACLSASDVGVIVGSVLDGGDLHSSGKSTNLNSNPEDATSKLSYSQRVQGVGSNGLDTQELAIQELDRERADSATTRFWMAYDALDNIIRLESHIHAAQYLHRAILRTGTSLIEKKQIRHLKAFRMAVVKEGPDVQLFTHPGALVKLALWVAEAVIEMEGGRRSSSKKGSELVMASLDERRGSYLVVGLGGGGAVALDKERQKRRAEKRRQKQEKKEAKRAEKQKKKEERRINNGFDDFTDSEDEEEEELETESEDSDSDSEDEAEQPKPRGHGRNRFGMAFNEVVAETGIRSHVDSFDHCIVQVRKEDLSSFLEALSLKVVIG